MRPSIVVLIALLASAVPVNAQYPERSVTVLNPFPAGGLSDLCSRALVEGMKKSFPRGIAVLNHPGGGGSIAISDLVGARPDGHTLAFTPIAALVVQPQMNDVPYKTPDDYEPIVNVVAYYPMLAVPADSPLRTAQDFLASARANPGKIRVGSSGIGTSAHLNLEELLRVARISVNHVPFSGWAEGSAALLGKHVDALTVNPGEVRSLVDAKRIRILAAFSPDRSRYYPDVPTWKELGDDAAIGLWFLLIAPKGTPPNVVKFVHDSAKAAMDTPAFAKFVQDREIQTDYRGGDKLRADLWQEYRKHTEILKRLGLLKH